MFFKNKSDNKLITKIRKRPLPNHIAIIMDGNGRWAKRRGLPRTAGHHEGGKALLNTLKTCNELGVKALTVYAFSTENWKRPQEEVDYLMDLPNKYIDKYLPRVKNENIRMNFIGILDELPESLKSNVNKAIEETKNNTGLIFTIALNYGSQREIIEATKQIVDDVVNQKLTSDDINIDVFESKLHTADLPQLDLLIRTSGEIRISNYLLWQLAYSELYFTKKYWPDFNQKELLLAIEEYQRRNRRYGGV